MISLAMSFLSLAWAATVADTVLLFIDVPNWKNKLLLFVTYIFLLSSRLFAIAFFTVSYKWWIISVLMIHGVKIFTADTIWLCQIGECDAGEVSESACLCCFHWLRDDMSKLFQASFEFDVLNKKQWITGTILFSNVLFVVENVTMILVVYMFSEFSNTWYSLPVTICVCSFSVLGAIIRVIHFRFSHKEEIEIIGVSLSDILKSSEVNQSDESSQQEEWFVYVTAV